MCQKHIYRNLVLDAGGKTGGPGKNLQKQVWTGNQMHTWLLDWESNSGPVVHRAGKNHNNTCFPNKEHHNIDEWCPLFPPLTFNEWVASYMVYLVGRSFHLLLSQIQKYFLYITNVWFLHSTHSSYFSSLKFSVTSNHNLKHNLEEQLVLFNIPPVPICIHFIVNLDSPFPRI